MPEQRANSTAVITDRARIIALWECNLPVNVIAHRTGLHRSTVHKWIKRWQEEGSVQTRPRSGRPKVTTPQQDQAIVEASQRSPFISALKITRDLGLICSPLTTRRRLHASGIMCRVPAVKEALNRTAREHRLGFALQYSAEDATFWQNIIFSDEKCFCSVKPGERICWRVRNTRYSERNINERARSGRVSTAMWGWMWAFGPGELIQIEGRLTSEKYISILESLLRTVRTMAIPAPQTIKVVQDQTPIHTSHRVREWAQLHPEIEFLDWPTKGCDMNPIENLWGIMVRDWDIGQERTKEAIARHAQDVWESIRRRPNICLNLVNSMPKRLNEVIEAHGGWIKY